MSSGCRWPNNLLRGASNIKRSGGTRSIAVSQWPEWCRLTQGGTTARSLAVQKHWSLADPRNKRKEALPFITALRYFISLTCSEVGTCWLPNTRRISSRNRRRTWGLSASIAMTKVRVVAVCVTLLASGRWLVNCHPYRVPPSDHNVNGLILNELVVCAPISPVFRRPSLATYHSFV